MDYLSIINKYYPDDDALRQLLLKHSRQVADRCLQIVKKHVELPVDGRFSVMVQSRTSVTDRLVVICCVPRVSPVMPVLLSAIREQACQAMSRRH